MAKKALVAVTKTKPETVLKTSSSLWNERFSLSS